MKKDNRKYYAAYEERYKTAHAHGVSWSSDVSTPVVMEVIDQYKISQNQRILEIGCGEGRDSRTVLEHGFQLTATDISKEAIAYCKKIMPKYENNFCVLDCLSDDCTKNLISSSGSPLFTCSFWMRTETAFISSFVTI